MQTRRLLACVLALALLCGPAAAGENGDQGFLSRITLAVPLFTRHMPNDKAFNDDNWGAFALFALDDDLFVTAGDFINSYKRNTAFAALTWLPLGFDAANVRFDFGGTLGVDLNGGYKRYSSFDPLIGALNIKIGARDIEPGLLNRLGLLVTVIPPADSHGSTAANLALTFRL
jgi:hypothetical protein